MTLDINPLSFLSIDLVLGLNFKLLSITVETRGVSNNFKLKVSNFFFN
jgi:hypothetical protein